MSKPTEDNHNPETMDEALMGRFQAGDEEAFRVLFDRYASHLINFAYRSLHSREEAEDVAQETLLRVYRGKDRYDPRRPFRPWIFSIAIHLVSNWARDKKRHPGVSLDWEGYDSENVGSFEVPDQPSARPPEAVEKQELAVAVQGALSSLPESQRTAVILARFQEMSYEEIAQAMGSSIPTVKSLLFRARQSLKTALESYAKRFS